ncbi:MAG: lipopolysaccharide biosynthesis protein [Deltaproteobacteria bacterium]|nr:lipopolysaccharide biosynthesis protein [Deltaproteobacteria bacterium]
MRWAFVMNWGRQGGQSVITLILAALLGPEAFGLVAMAMVYLAFFQLFLGMGLTGALIHRTDLEPGHLDAAFWLVMATTGALVVLSLLAAEPWAAANRTPALADAIRALTPTLLFRGLSVVQQAILQKRMDFRALAIRSNLAVLGGGIVGLVMAASGFGLWALVAQQLITTFCEAALLWKLSAWRPRLRFSPPLARELLSFSSRVLLSRLGLFAQRRSDAVILGYFFGPVALALYRMGERLMQLAIELCTRPIAVVALPNFSRLQNDPDELRRAGTATLKASAILGIPALTGLALVSEPLVALIGERWQAVAPVLEILCILGAARTLTLFTGSLLQAVGRPGLLAAIQWSLAVVNVVTFTGVGLFLREAPVLEQIQGIAAVRTGAFVLLYMPVSLGLLLHFSGNTPTSLLRAVVPAGVGALGVAAAVWIARVAMGPGFAAPLQLAIEVAVGGVVGVAVLAGVDADFRRQAAGLVTRLHELLAPRRMQPGSGRD